MFILSSFGQFIAAVQTLLAAFCLLSQTRRERRLICLSYDSSP